MLNIYNNVIDVAQFKQNAIEVVGVVSSRRGNESERCGQYLTTQNTDGTIIEFCHLRVVMFYLHQEELNWQTLAWK